MAALEIVVLLSVGRHPVTGAPRRAPRDARALDLALAMGGPVHAVHAGPPAEAALREYLGQGLDAVILLEQPEGADPVPALVEFLTARQPHVVLAGVRSESGEDSGMVPYLAARALGAAIVPGIVSLSAARGTARLVQGLARGRRRAVSVPLPIVATVDLSAPAPRQSAYARARRGEIVRVAAPGVADPGWQSWQEQRARPRPKRLKAPIAGTAHDRIRAMAETRSGSGLVLDDLAPDAAARAIYDYLASEGIVERPSEASPRPTEAEPQ